MANKKGVDLNERQELFCQGVAAGNSHTKAALDAGYSPKTAGATADKLLKNVKISSCIAVLMDKTAQKHEITKDWIVNQLKDVVNSPNKASDRVAALKELSKMLGFDKIVEKPVDNEFIVYFGGVKK